MAKEIFRHDSVERLSSPAQLNKLLVVIRLRGWVVLATLVAIILGILVWSFVGEIPIITTGRGILLAPDAQYTLTSPADGVVTQVNIKSGDQVRKGQVLMVLSDGQKVLAPADGTIFQMEESKGQQVKQGDVLMWFERKV